MRRLCALLVLLPFVAFGETDMKFAHYRDAAQPLEDGGLGDFLDKYIGACTGFFDGQRCKDKAAAFRAEHADKPHWTTIREGDADMVQMTAFNPMTNEYTLRITPVFAAGGYFLSNGRPDRLDDDGTPLFRVLDVQVKAKPGKTAMDVSRLYSEKVLRVQVVFTPRDTWIAGTQRQPRYGVAADVHAILVTIGATGEKIGAWFETKPVTPPAEKPARAKKKT
jgi:hypothetical protein